MKVLVTGGGGLLGRALVPALIEREHDVETYLHEKMDVTKRELVDYIVADQRPNWIAHLAAYTNVDGAETDAEAAFAVNAEGTRYVSEAAARIGARVLFPSTDYVFAGTASRPYREDDPVAPAGVYARSKLAGEDAVRDSGARHLVARTSWLFGEGGRNFVDTILTRAARGEALRVVRDQIGSPTYASDLAAALVELMEQEALGLLHVSNRGACSWYDLARAALEAAAYDPPPVTPITSRELARPAPRPAFSALDTGACERLLGRPLPSWEDAVGRYVKRRGAGARERSLQSDPS